MGTDRVRDLRCHRWHRDGETELSCVLGTDVPRAPDRRARDSSVVNTVVPGDSVIVRNVVNVPLFGAGLAPCRMGTQVSPRPVVRLPGVPVRIHAVPDPVHSGPVNVRGSQLMVTATVAPWMIPNSAPRVSVGGRVISGGAAGFGDRDCLYGWAEAGGRIIRVACVPLARPVVVDFSCLCHRGRPAAAGDPSSAKRASALAPVSAMAANRHAMVLRPGPTQGANRNALEEKSDLSITAPNHIRDSLCGAT